MWTVQIVVDAPFLDDLPGMPVAAEQMFVEALVTQSAVERFHEAILHGLSGRDLVPLDTTIRLPSKDGVRCQFRPVVADHQGSEQDLFLATR